MKYQQIKKTIGFKSLFTTLFTTFLFSSCFSSTAFSDDHLGPDQNQQQQEAVNSPEDMEDLMNHEQMIHELMGMQEAAPPPAFDMLMDGDELDLYRNPGESTDEFLARVIIEVGENDFVGNGMGDEHHADALPIGLNNATMIEFNGTLFIYGGITGQLGTGNYFSHDIQYSNDGGLTWQVAAEKIPDHISGAEVVEANGELWIFGGNIAQPGAYTAGDGQAVFKSTDGFNWTVVSDGLDASALPAVGIDFDVVFHDGKFVATGFKTGDFGNEFMSEVYESSDGINWTKISDIVPPRIDFQMISDGHDMYIIGGYENINFPDGFFGQATDSVLRSSDGGQTWTEVGNLPLTRVGHQAVAFDGVLLVLGGWENYSAQIPPNNQNHQIFVSKDNGETWELEESFGIPGFPANMPRNFASAVSQTTGRVVLAGGNGSSRTVVTYSRLGRDKVPPGPLVIGENVVQFQRRDDQGNMQTITVTINLHDHPEPDTVARNRMDQDGDGFLNPIESRNGWRAFQLTRGLSEGDDGFNALYDFDDNGTVDGMDWFLLQEAFFVFTTADTFHASGRAATWTNASGTTFTFRDEAFYGSKIGLVERIQFANGVELVYNEYWTDVNPSITKNDAYKSRDRFVNGVLDYTVHTHEVGVNDLLSGGWAWKQYPPQEIGSTYGTKVWYANTGTKVRGHRTAQYWEASGNYREYNELGQTMLTVLGSSGVHYERPDGYHDRLPEDNPSDFERTFEKYEGTAFDTATETHTRGAFVYSWQISETGNRIVETWASGNVNHRIDESFYGDSRLGKGRLIRRFFADGLRYYENANWARDAQGETDRQMMRRYFIRASVDDNWEDDLTNWYYPDEDHRILSTHFSGAHRSNRIYTYRNEDLGRVMTRHEEPEGAFRGYSYFGDPGEPEGDITQRSRELRYEPREDGSGFDLVLLIRWIWDSELNQRIELCRVENSDSCGE